MTAEKQIEEMAKAIHINCHKGLTEDEAEMIAKWCYQEIDRKVSDVAREIVQIAKDSAETYVNDVTLDYYTRTAIATMLEDFITRLKKKYTEEN